MTRQERNLIYLDKLAEGEYNSQPAKKKRALISLRNIISRYFYTERQLKVYQQAAAHFIAEHPEEGYELQGLILKEQDKINVKEKTTESE